MKKQINLSKVCPKGCYVTWTTSESNGYPRNEQEAIVGFENEAQLDAFLEMNPNFVAVFLESKPGWNHCARYYPIEHRIDNTIGVPELWEWVDNKYLGFIDDMTEIADEYPEDAKLARELISAFKSMNSNEILVYSFIECVVPFVIKRFTMMSDFDWQDGVVYRIGAMLDY